MVVPVGISISSSRSEPGAMIRVVQAFREVTKSTPVVGSAAAGPSIFTPNIARAPEGTDLAQVVIPMQRRGEERPNVELIHQIDGLLPQLRREVDEVIVGKALHIVGRRLRRERLVAASFSPGISPRARVAPPWARGAPRSPG